MTGSFDHEIDKVEDEYYGEDEDDLGDFIVYSDEDEDKASRKQKQEVEDQEEEEDEEGNEFEGEDDEDDDDVEAPVGAQEILRLREQLKEKIRRRNAAMAAGVGRCSSSVKQTAPPAKDRFGTFFGPSRQSLAPRVIQEGYSSMMKELQTTTRSKSNASLTSKAQPNARKSLQKPKIVVTEEKRKADALRENRDYSSLFSDDVEAPSRTNEQPGSSRSALKHDIQPRGPVGSAGKARAHDGQTARLPSNGYALKGAPPSSQGRAHNKAGSPGNVPLADRKRTVATAARNGSTPAAMKKTMGLHQPTNGRKLQPTIESKKPQALLPGHRQQQSSQGRQKLQQAPQSQRLQSNSHQQIRKNASSAQGQHSGQNGSAPEPQVRGKPAQKQAVASSKLKASRPVEKRAAKRKSDHEDYKSFISKEIGALFPRYDPSKYSGQDENDSDMEADYASILKEERRSAKLARQEDQEQLRLIQEEEARERAKKREKSQQLKQD